jgi:hypothetical protein
VARTSPFKISCGTLEPDGCTKIHVRVLLPPGFKVDSGVVEVPILYIHGVAIRNDDYWQPLERLLRTFVAPVIADDPQNVLIDRCYWGDLGARFMGRSLPDSAVASLKALPQKARPLAGHIAELGVRAEEKVKQVKGKAGQKALELKVKTAERLKDARQALAKGVETSRRFLHLRDLPGDTLSDMAAAAVAESGAEPECATLAIMACDEIASEAATAGRLARCKSVEEEVAVISQLIHDRYHLLAGKQGVTPGQKPVWLKPLATHLVEGMERSVDMPGFLVTRAAAEAKGLLNTFVAQFLGDVFTYMRQRGNWQEPGPIPRRVLEALRLAQANKMERHSEPLVVLTHSMGGQVLYDALTHFIPKMPEYGSVRVDFWCACASQVGYFEELKLFLESKEATAAKVPRPSAEQLGWWWNVWDHNDFVSWRAGSIFDEVDDQPYNSGMFLVSAHGGYLVRPSFFRKFALKAEAAKKANWLLQV